MLMVGRSDEASRPIGQNADDETSRPIGQEVGDEEA